MPRSKAEPLASAQDVPLEDWAAHIAEVSGELALLAGRARWPLLTYFLNMARVEAESRIAAAADHIDLQAPRPRIHSNKR